MTAKNSKPSEAFTIVELLVVIVVIGILASITIVSYTGISGRATAAVLQSDLASASSQLKMYQATYGTYPTALNGSNCPTSPTPDSTLCLRTSSGNSYNNSYSSNGTTFSLIETSANGVAYNVTESTSAAAYPWVNWYPGITATVLAGKYVYKTDLGPTFMYKPANNAVTSPQGVTGLDPNYPSNMVLVSPKTNPGVDFSAYPGQNACKAIGGRLPNMPELLAIYASRALYGNNFQSGDNYWSATEYNSNVAYGMSFGSGVVNGYTKTDTYSVRCVSE